MTFPKAIDIQEAARITPVRPHPDRNRRAVSRPRPQARQAQRTRLRRRNGAQAGRTARRHARTRSPQTTTDNFGGCLGARLKVPHGIRQARPNPYRSRNLRPRPRRTSIKSSAKSASNRSLPSKPSTISVNICNRAAASAFAPCWCCFQRQTAWRRQSHADPHGRCGGNDSHRDAGA